MPRPHLTHSDRVSETTPKRRELGQLLASILEVSGTSREDFCTQVTQINPIHPFADKDLQNVLDGKVIGSELFLQVSTAMRSLNISGRSSAIVGEKLLGAAIVAASQEVITREKYVRKQGKERLWGLLQQVRNRIGNPTSEEIAARIEELTGREYTPQQVRSMHSESGSDNFNLKLFQDLLTYYRDWRTQNPDWALPQLTRLEAAASDIESPGRG